MVTVTDPTADTGERENSPNPNHASGSNGVHVPSEKSPETIAGGGPETTVGGEAGAKPAIEFSPAPEHIRRSQTAGTGLFSFLSGGNGGIPRHGSGGIPRHGSGGIPRHGSGSVGIPRHGSGSVGGGGIHRGRSGVHLPSLSSISFSMARLPEEDAGLQMHFTETKEVETLPEEMFPDDDDADGPPRKPRNRMRKHLTAVGACSFGFRLSECVLSLISVIVMCANSQHMGAGFGTLKFDHFQAYK